MTRLETLQVNIETNNPLGEEDTKFIGVRVCPVCKEKGIKIIDCNKDIAWIHHGKWNQENGGFDIVDFCEKD